LLAGISEQKNKVYQIELTNKRKIITGLSLLDSSDVTLPTRKLQNVVDVGFTFEESLYFYAYGFLKVEIRKIEENGCSREPKKYIKNRDI